MTFLQASQPSHSTFLQESKSNGQKKEVISPTNIKNKQTDYWFSKLSAISNSQGPKNRRKRSSPYCNSLKNQPVDTLYNSQITSHNQSKHTKKCFSTERRNHSPLRRAGLAIKKVQRSLQGSWVCILRTEQK